MTVRDLQEYPALAELPGIAVVAADPDQARSRVDVVEPGTVGRPRQPVGQDEVIVDHRDLPGVLHPEQLLRLGLIAQGEASDQEPTGRVAPAVIEAAVLVRTDQGGPGNGRDRAVRTDRGVRVDGEDTAGAGDQ
jgi:hypothetical protein